MADDEWCGARTRWQLHRIRWRQDGGSPGLACDEVDPPHIGEAEVVDVRTLLPLDTATIYNSVKKTHRAVVVYEDWRSGGFGAEIVSRIQEDCFDDLDAPVGRVGGLNVPMPYARNLELLCIPSEEDVIKVVHKIR